MNNTLSEYALSDSVASTPRHVRTDSSISSYPTSMRSKLPQVIKLQQSQMLEEQIQHVLHIQKENSNIEMLQLYFSIKNQPSCSLSRELLDLIHNFLSIPSEKFSLSSFAQILRQLGHCFLEAVEEQLISFFSESFQKIIQQLTNLATILSGTLSIQKPDMCILPQLAQVIFQNFDLTQYLDNGIGFFTKKRIQARIKQITQNVQQLSALKYQLVSIQFKLFDQLDVLDSLARKELKLNPPKFPSNSSSVERILQFIMDCIELNDYEDIEPIIELDRQFHAQKKNISFRSDNPFLFEISIEDDDLYSPKNNDFYKYSAVYPRPRVISALSNFLSQNISQKIMFVTESQTQFLNLLSYLSEESDCNFTILDAPNLINVVKFLSQVVNQTFPYVINNYQRLRLLQKKMEFPVIRKQYENLLKECSTVYNSFMKDKLGCISIQFIAYQYLLEYLCIQNDIVVRQQPDNYNKLDEMLYSLDEQPIDLPLFDRNSILSYNDTPFYRFYLRHDVFLYLLQLIGIYMNKIKQIYQLQKENNKKQLANTSSQAASTPNSTTSLTISLFDVKTLFDSDDQLLQQALSEMTICKFTQDFVSKALAVKPECDSVMELFNNIYQLYVYQNSRRHAGPSISEYSTPVVVGQQLPKTPQLSDFTPISFISRGGYGCVVHVMNQRRHHFAIKIIRKEDIIRKNSVNRIKLEQIIYKTMNEQRKTKIDFVVKFYGSFKTDQFLFLVLEYCPNGDLGQLLECCGCFTLRMTKQYIAEILQALHQMHSIGITYNDLKPENLLMATSGHIKFTDFGISKLAFLQQQQQQDNISPQISSQHISFQSQRRSMSFCSQVTLQKQLLSESTKPQTKAGSISRNSSNENMRPNHECPIGTRKKAYSVIGTPFYLAPEVILQQGSTPASDYWALGVCLYEFCFGLRPFDGENPEQIFQAILKGEYPIFDDFFQEGFKEDHGVLEVISKLLIEDPNQRLHDFDELKQLEFFQDVKWDDLLAQTPEYIPQQIQLSETPMELQGNWVDYVVSEAGFHKSCEEIPVKDDQFQGFSYVNVNAFNELQNE